MDRNVKQSEWLVAGGWGSRVVGQDHYRDHTTEPVLSPGNPEDTDNRPGTMAHGRPPRLAPRVKDQEQKQFSQSFAGGGG